MAAWSGEPASPSRSAHLPVEEAAPGDDPRGGLEVECHPGEGLGGTGAARAGDHLSWLGWDALWPA